jgi:hypothetical protein
MATGLGFRACFSVLANSQHRWVREKQSYKKKLQKKHNILYVVQIF